MGSLNSEPIQKTNVRTKPGDFQGTSVLLEGYIFIAKTLNLDWSLGL